MSKRKLAPQLGDISREDFKKRRRRIKVLADQRLAYGKGTFFKTDNHEPRYPIDEIAAALIRALKVSNEVNKHLEISTEEKNLLAQVFRALMIIFGAFILAVTHSVDPQPSIVCQDPDWIEKALGLADGEIEKRLGLPEHEIEKALGATEDRQGVHGAPEWNQD